MMGSISDEDLISRIRRRDEAAWSTFVATYEGRIRGYLVKRLADKSQGDDLVQETFLGFLTSLPNYDARTPIDSFLFSIAAHKLTDHLRKSGRRPSFNLGSMESSHGSPFFGTLAGTSRKASSMARSREQRDLDAKKISEALQQLISQWISKQDYTRLKCIELLFVRGWKNNRVAVQLSLTEQDVANHKSYVMRQLQQFISD